MQYTHVDPRTATQIPEPPVARFLFADTRMAWFWLIVRLYAGYEWLTAGFEKMTGTSINITTFGQKVGGSWISGKTAGLAMKGFVGGALKQSTGAHANVQGWYATFLQNAVLPHTLLWSYAITFGEILVGLGLIFGILTGIASFFGLAMNFNYLLAGSVSTNPMLGFIAIMLVLAWRIAGYYGGDRYLLPLLGTPWTGSLAKSAVTSAEVRETVASAS